MRYITLQYILGPFFPESTQKIKAANVLAASQELFLFLRVEREN